MFELFDFLKIGMFASSVGVQSFQGISKGLSELLVIIDSGQVHIVVNSDLSGGRVINIVS